MANIHGSKRPNSAIIPPNYLCNSLTLMRTFCFLSAETESFHNPLQELGLRPDCRDFFSPKTTRAKKPVRSQSVPSSDRKKKKKHLDGFPTRYEEIPAGSRHTKFEIGWLVFSSSSSFCRSKFPIFPVHQSCR